MENIPKHTKKEDYWESFIEICLTDEEKIKREKGKLSREHMKLPHTSGRLGCARIEEELGIGRDGNGRVRGLGTGVTKTVVHASALYIKIVEEEKRKHESTDENVKLVMQRLDEETRARKILEKKLEGYAPEFENTSPQCHAESLQPLLPCVSVLCRLLGQPSI
ncbi:hypothetical protein IFM89_015129 [Coptis chinensis]|uniref:Uncharacterized protein n=1 Tax=Coptis chinensis TaxID=261450 RepID=A0A835I517_9MAGN|nr:hypothetical protein IFM89_015129 [Coptis chinensis]